MEPQASDRKPPLLLGALILITAAAVGMAIYYHTRQLDWQPGSATGPFGEGRQAVTEGRYDAAIPLLRDYLERNGTSGRNSSRAQFFLGKAYVGMGDMPAARAAFETATREYPDSLEAHKSRYKLAVLDLLEGRRAEARRRFGELADHPDGPLAGEAAAFRRYLDSTPSGGTSGAED